MQKITQVYAREILDSRATPTVEAVVFLEDGSYGVASVPSGASTGAFEAHELRDGDKTRYLGLGVQKAVNYINQEIAGRLVGQQIDNVAAVDNMLISLDATRDKSRLGANAILGVSLAVAKALAMSAKLPLYKYIAQIANNTSPLFVPMPLFNMINGGKHGAGNLDFQEFHVIPSCNGNFAKAMQIGSEVYMTLKKLLARRGAIHSVGDEGGFAPNLFTNLDAFEILNESITDCGYKISIDVDLGTDVAANSFYKDGRYVIKDRSGPLETSEFIEYLRDLNKQYNLRIIEDPLVEDDWKGWGSIMGSLGNVTAIVGDDLLVTNKERVARAVVEKSCNAILVKPNQIGTVTETIEVIKMSRAAGWKVITSHRSGETNDTFIADFAVGVGSDYAKFGAPARGERVAKYNRLLAIETELGKV